MIRIEADSGFGTICGTVLFLCFFSGVRIHQGLPELLEFSKGKFNVIRSFEGGAFSSPSGGKVR